MTGGLAGFPPFVRSVAGIVGQEGTYHGDMETMERKTLDRAAFLASMLVVSVASGCASANKPPRIVWPFPPDTPRIEYKRTLKSSLDVESGFRRFWSALSGKSALRLENPTSLAFSPDEKRLYVACSPKGYVVYFDFETGTMRRAADIEGRRPRTPFGLAVDGEGNLYVSDQGDKLVWVYSADGKFLREIGRGMFDRPAGIAFDRRRQLLYVVDGSNGGSRRHRVEVFAPDGRHIRTIGTRGSNPGEFNFPSHVTVAPDGKVYVADTLNFRIQVFDAEGTFQTMFGEGGDAPGQFGKIKGIAFDTFGNLYVVDGQVGVVQMFNSRFQPLMFFGGVINSPQFMWVPNAIVIDSKNRIFVSDFGFSQVNEYALINTTAADSEAPASKPESAPKSESSPRPENTGEAAPGSPAPVSGDSGR